MKILLLGEYSNVHWSLAEGLRQLGHKVTVISDGDGWKDYRRDVDLRRHALSPIGTLTYLTRLVSLLPQMKRYDVVHVINPVFLTLKAEHIGPFYRYLRRFNHSLFMGAYGVDHYWVKTCLDCTTFRYSDFNLGKEIRHSTVNDIFIQDWLKGEKGRLNRYIAKDCDGIEAGLYEYYCCYKHDYSDKLRFIPFPVIIDETDKKERTLPQRVKFFIGIQKQRNEYKGTDIMLRALERLKEKYPDRCEIRKAESVPFETYRHLMDECDVMLDQLYSYTPAMNALMAMAKGLVVVGGGEPEAYNLLGDNDLRPIVNVEPDEENVYSQLERLVLHPELIPDLSKKSIRYIERYHDARIVARQYIDFWSERLRQCNK